MAVKECCCGKLLYTKKSIFGLRMGSQILYLLFAASFILSCLAAESNAQQIKCSDVRQEFNRKDPVTTLELVKEPNSDAGGLCLNSGCCSAADSDVLVQRAKSQLESSLKTELETLASTLSSRAMKVDEFFRILLDESRKSFHNMFKRTYGMIYEQHSFVFQDLFNQLEKYYTKGDTNFELMMDKFFSILYEKMFAVLNAQYQFDSRYLKCVSSNMRDIQPFEDVPHKLSLQLRRAFVATRIFHKSLQGGADVVRNMKPVEVSVECARAFARMLHCGTCSGIEVKACSRYCHNILRGCLPTFADLNEQWDAYVDAVDKVGDRLLGPFNIAMVVEPIDIKISEAIMSFQEHNQEISNKIFSICGKPVLGENDKSSEDTAAFGTPERKRRFARALPDFDWNPKTNDVDDFEIEASFESVIHEDPSLVGLRTPEGIRKATKEMEEQAKSRERFLQYMKGKINLDEYEEYEEPERTKREAAASSQLDFRLYEVDERRPKSKKPAAKVEEGHGADWGAPALHKLVRDTRSRLRESRRFWIQIPVVLCTDLSTTGAACFNGSAMGSYTRSPAGEGSAALASNPEVRGSSSPTALETKRVQLEGLKALTSRLKDAYNGIEVQWKGDDLPQPSASSRIDIGDFGSGSGSGDRTDDTEDVPDDIDDGDYPEGSGETPPEDPTELNPTSTEAPFVPGIVDAPDTNNVDLRGRADGGAEPGAEPDAAAPRPVADAADRPSLHKALFTYALPVVCAWFGTIVTDLF
ncbi:glypican-6 isoform X2 [Amyelois transitella]|uniref:glypican-6 isoform X2 n=1 Tax=Amyelois transitella TaxID=680683 RepID=UPI00298FA9CA|nr:glypican-6 isoform X2 [Amyelois transitella]